MKRRMKLILQHDKRDCGAVCLSMIAEYFGHKVPVSRCRELTRTDRSGANLYGMIDGAAALGFDAETLNGEPGDLIEGLKSGDISFPFVAGTVSDDGMHCYIVLYGIKHGDFLVADPAKGYYRMGLNRFVEYWSGYIVTFEKTDAFRQTDETKGSLTQLSILLQGQKGRLAASLALSALIAGAGIAGALIFRFVIDDTKGTGEELPVIFGGLIGLFALQALIRFLRGYLISKTAQKIDVRLSMTYYSRLLNLPAAALYMRQSGEFLSRFTDTAVIRTALSAAAITLVLDLVMVIACGVMLFTENVLLALIAVLPVFLCALIMRLYKTPLARQTRKVVEERGLLQSYVKETMDGVETIRAAEAEKEITEKVKARYGKLAVSDEKKSMLALTESTLAEAVKLIGAALILWAGFSFYFNGRITAGTLVSFFALFVYLIRPVQNLLEFQPSVEAALIAADRLNDVMVIAPQELEDKGEEGEVPRVEEWQLSHVDFRYGNHGLILRNVNLTIKRGQRIAIVGESGCGKTTLARLFIRLYDPEKGEILLNGTPITDFNLASLRNNVAYVGQNSFFFSDTIRNNLKLGNPYVTDDEIDAACRTSRADEFLSRLPDGLETRLDENGANLSGGQRQRLAIARALLKKPQLLILDEAASSLDNLTEMAVKNMIFDQNSDMTCLVIAHRLSTIRACDEIYVMHRGRIVERGTHTKLLSTGGYYANLWLIK